MKLAEPAAAVLERGWSRERREKERRRAGIRQVVRREWTPTRKGRNEYKNTESDEEVIVQIR